MMFGKKPYRHSRMTALAAALIALSMLAACGKDEKKVQRPPVPVTVGATERKAVPYEIRAIGNVEAYTSVLLKSQVSGQLAKIHFTDGQFVKKGALLFTIDPRQQQAVVKQFEAALARDEAQVANAREDERRYAELLRKGYISRQQYDQARTSALALEATVAASRANLDAAKTQLGYYFIYAPIAGRAGDTKIDLGNQVKASDDNKFLTTINQIEPIHVSFSVPEKNLAEIRKHMATRELAVMIYLDKADATPEKGKLTFVDNAVDSATGTIKLKATLKNANHRLWPGQFVNVVLSLYIQPDAVVVPSESVQAGQAGQFVYVIKDDLTAETRPVTVARTFGNESIIEKGVAPGERVVTDGQLRLVPGAKVQLKGAPEAAAPKPGEPVPESQQAPRKNKE
jgi:multidrug efflux system membrane fusion protein